MTIESDNKMANSLSVSELLPSWEVQAVVLDIRDLRRQHKFDLVWVRRTANRVAHQVARVFGSKGEAGV